jgi:hypothetical protein
MPQPSHLRIAHAYLLRRAARLKIDEKRYVRDKGNRCPFCGSRNIEVDSEGVEADGGEVWAEVSCENCWGEWADLYKLASITVQKDGSADRMGDPAEPDYPLATGRRASQPLSLRPDYGTPEDKTADASWAKLFPRNSYLNKFFAEKRIPSRMFEITDSHGVAHSIPNDVVVETIAQTSGRELAQIENTIRQIDFKNGDVNHFLEHLAGAIAEQYSGALRFATSDFDTRYVIEVGDPTPEATRNIRGLLKHTVGLVDEAAYRGDMEFQVTTGDVRQLKSVVKNIRTLDGIGSVQVYLGDKDSLTRMAADKRAFNKYNPDDLLSALVDILEKYELDEVVDEVKKLTPTVQKAWRSRER